MFAVKLRRRSSFFVEGHSRRKTSRVFGLSRKTVSKICLALECLACSSFLSCHHDWPGRAFDAVAKFRDDPSDDGKCKKMQHRPPANFGIVRHMLPSVSGQTFGVIWSSHSLWAFRKLLAEAANAVGLGFTFDRFSLRASLILRSSTVATAGRVQRKPVEPMPL
jgi:hypothetical protein